MSFYLVILTKSLSLLETFREKEMSRICLEVQQKYQEERRKAVILEQELERAKIHPK